MNDHNEKPIAVLGAGVIGASWTSLFLAAGYHVKVYDPSDGIQTAVADSINDAWPTLEALNLTKNGDPRNYSFHDTPQSAVEGALFVKENVPERIEVKHDLYRKIESSLLPEAVVASSASGLMVKEMQKGWSDPSRFILGHPFNPPHLIPLVELVANDLTAPGVLELAESFYESVGKVTIRVNREVPAHVANRLQAALWKEAIYLVQSGVASVEDVDKAVWAGPGLRWAAMGPHMLFNLGAGEGGMQEFCARYADSFHRWWDDLGDVEITLETITQLVKGIEEEAKGESLKPLADQRDKLIVEFLIRKGDGE
ncbi:MAG: 3-hydroxyacyl-CoA dehydrogenase [Gammaproteobacteria bacterium]|nr:3-hydroxyacyl-CoA dehydrogenase [Gammaproteobacteria bacterium]